MYVAMRWFCMNLISYWKCFVSPSLVSRDFHCLEYICFAGAMLKNDLVELLRTRTHNFIRILHTSLHWNAQNHILHTFSVFLKPPTEVGVSVSLCITASTESNWTIMIILLKIQIHNRFVEEIASIYIAFCTLLFCSLRLDNFISFNFFWKVLFFYVITLNIVFLAIFRSKNEV